MKNYIIYFFFIVVLPTSFGKSGNTGCSSKKTEISEEKSDQIQKSDKEKEKKPKKTGQKKGATNDIDCYAFMSIE